MYTQNVREVELDWPHTLKSEQRYYLLIYSRSIKEKNHGKNTKWKEVKKITQQSKKYDGSAQQLSRISEGATGISKSFYLYFWATIRARPSPNVVGG